MNEIVGIFNNSIKCRNSLEECIEFAFEDEEIGIGEDGRLVALISKRGAKKSSVESACHEMMPKNQRVSGADYLYTIGAFSWSDTDPETEFEFALWDTEKMYPGHKALVSVHVCDEAIYVHTLVKREPGADWKMPENFPKFCAISPDAPAEVREYCEAMQYLMH